MCIHLYSVPRRRFPVEDIPDNEEECANWLHKLYQEKVKLIKPCMIKIHTGHGMYIVCKIFS